MPLSLDELRAIAGWAADGAARVLPLFESAAPGDPRPREAIDAARAFASGGVRVHRLRTLAVASYAAAREVSDPAAQAAARSAGTAASAAYLHPLATLDQAKHLLSPVAYAALAQLRASGDVGAGEAEIAHAAALAPPAVRAVLARMPARDAGRGEVAALLHRVDAALRR